MTTVRTKLFLVSITLVVASAAAADAYLTSLLATQMTRVVRADLFAQAQLAAREAGVSVTDDARDRVAFTRLAAAIDASTGSRVTFLQLDGTVVGDSQIAPADLARADSQASRPEVEAALATGQGTSERADPTTRDPMMVAAVMFRRGAETAGVVRLAASLLPVDRARPRRGGREHGRERLDVHGVARPDATLNERHEQYTCGVEERHPSARCSPCEPRALAVTLTAASLAPDSTTTLLFARGMLARSRQRRGPRALDRAPRVSILKLGKLRGFLPVGDVLAEDYVLGRRFFDAGFVAKTSMGAVENRNVGCPLARTLERHTRWSKMRRSLSPLTFVVEPIRTPSSWRRPSGRARLAA